MRPIHWSPTALGGGAPFIKEVRDSCINSDLDTTSPLFIVATPAKTSDSYTAHALAYMRAEMAEGAPAHAAFLRWRAHFGTFVLGYALEQKPEAHGMRDMGSTWNIFTRLFMKGVALEDPKRQIIRNGRACVPSTYVTLRERAENFARQVKGGRGHDLRKRVVCTGCFCTHGEPDLITCHYVGGYM